MGCDISDSMSGSPVQRLSQEGRNSALQRMTAVGLAMVLLAGSLAYAEGRSMVPPFPSRAEDWPGVGAIRVFDWISYRRNFWLQRAEKQGSIVLAGELLTEYWPPSIRDFGGGPVANRAIGGEVSRGLLFRFQEDVLALKPKAIVVLIGINDLTAFQPASETLANIRAMLRLKQAQSPEVPMILCTVPPSADVKAPVDEEQRKLLDEGIRKSQTAKKPYHQSICTQPP